MCERHTVNNIILLWIFRVVFFFSSSFLVEAADDDEKKIEKKELYVYTARILEMHNTARDWNIFGKFKYQSEIPKNQIETKLKEHSARYVW